MEYPTNNVKEMYEIWDFLVDSGLCTEQTIGVVVALNGKTVKTLRDILYVITGYRTLDQLFEEEEEEE